MNKFFLLILPFLYTSLTFAQTENQLIIAAQPGFNVSKTRSVNFAGMAGIKSSEGDQFLAGLVYKNILPDVGHKGSYVGLRFHTQTYIGNNFAPFLSASVLQGEYYTYGSDNDVFIKKSRHIKGTLGMAYMFNDNVGLFAGYSIREYDPLSYYTSKKSPYKTGAINVKLSMNMALGGNFTTSGVGQRRMW